ncbi:tRNA (32-2'-O)-methyltransferase regulator THADA-like [Pelodytes ibericus]
MTVKMCLQMFRVLAENISPLVWTPSSSSKSLQSILEFLVQTITAQNISRDTRLLAGTAVASLANAAPTAELGAQAGLNLIQRLNNGTGKVRFGELCLSVPCNPTDGVGLLAFIRGLLTCGRPELLICELFAPTQNMTMLEHILPAVDTLCKAPNEQYYSFQVLCLWLQHLREQIGRILQIREGFFLATNGETLATVTQLLWMGAEIPMDGMCGLVLSCFQHCLHIHRTECKLLTLEEQPLLHDMLHKITETSWQDRSRYTPLCALLAFIGTETALTLYPMLPAHLFFCLSINYLCPPSSETYRIIITLQRNEWTQGVQLDEKELARRWADTWLIPLCDALTSTENSLQCNAATHLLPCTLRCFSESFALLEERFCGSSPSHLRGWVSLMRAQKVGLGRVTQDIMEKLEVCLESADNGVRLNALSFLCYGTRTNQPLSEQELTLLKKCLPFNLGCDSAGFRQQMHSALRRAIERLRDGALTTLRKGLSKAIDLSKTIDFLEWLLHVSVSAMSPAGNYQRRCSGLLMFSALLESCSDSWTAQKKKGQPPQDMSLLLNYAWKRGFWDFYSAQNMRALLACIQDSTNEIRDMASDLLVRFFLPAPEPVTLPLFELGKAFLCSPRVPLAEGGALIMKTLLQRSQGVVVVRGDEPFTALKVVTFLTEILQDHYCCAQDDLLQAATSKPLHGVLSALRLCLLEVPTVSQSLSESDQDLSWQCLIIKLVSSLREIATFILNVLRKAWDEDIPEAVAPSFADMGNAVSAMIAQVRGLEEVQGSVLLSEEHSLIMTCCWVSLKEIGLLLGPLVEKLISVQVPMLSLSEVQKSVATYQDIFLRCRHWGAVDGCSAGFTKLCCTLLHHEDPKLRSIPQQIIEQALNECRSQHSLSVTRRAAGFPVLLQSILCAEGPQHALLTSCIQSLLSLAKEPIPNNWDQTRDLPQVSAVHALQTMLRSTVLRSTLLTHAVTMMSLALQNLSSLCWAMRNAALQLFSSLTGGMLGLSRSDGDSSVQSTLSAGSLLRRFPGLKNVLLKELNDATKGGKMLYPSLHPILTLLARLQPGGDSEVSCFLEPLLGLAGNPIYAVRVMVARAIVPVVQVKDYSSLLFKMVEAIPNSNEGISHNALHGSLLQFRALLVVALRENCLTEDVAPKFSQRLLQALWLLTPLQKCPLIQASFLDVLSLLMPLCGTEYARLVAEAVGTVLNAHDHYKQVGSVVFHEACVLYLCNEAARSTDQAVHSHMVRLLRDGDPAVFKWLKEQQSIPTELCSAVRETLQDRLCSVLLPECPSERLRQCLEEFIHVHRGCSPFYSLKFPIAKDLHCANNLLALLESGTHGPQLRGNALATLSLLLKHGNLIQDLPICSRWLVALASCADPASSCEELRLAAANALELGGTKLVRQARSNTTPFKQLAVRAVGYGIDLLQDEDHNVRDAATRFAVGALGQPDEMTLQSDRSLLYLLKLLRECFWDCEETFHTLLLRLPPYDLLSALSTLQERSTCLYEEDESNVFADPLFLSSLLLPILCRLLRSMSTETPLCSSVLEWMKITVPPLKEQLKRCHRWAQELSPVSPLWLKASGCTRVQVAALGLFVHGQLLLRALEVLTEPQITQLGFKSGYLREELDLLEAELKPHRIGLPFMETPE